MKILLIAPAQNNFKTPRYLRIPSLSLSILASLVPPDIEVSIVEEEITDIDFNEKADLVGITTMTATASRAYEIADNFRNQGTTVVLGGIHPTALPEEAIKHADSVVIGEAEGCWEKVIRDYRKGKIEKFYRSGHPSLDNLPLPRWDLNGKKNVGNVIPILATRGCPYDCEFCSVTEFYGRKVRHRPVHDVIEDIKQSGGKTFIFLDDNIIGNPKYAKELFKNLISLKINWVGQASVSISKDKELLSLAQKSGCKALFFGVESVLMENLKTMKKTLNSLADYEKTIKVLRDLGIHFHASMILGFDEDDPSVFERTLKFLTKNKVGAVTFNLLTPYPGSRLYRRLKEEGRIIEQDWSLYNNDNVVFRPKRMTVEQLSDGYYWVRRQFYSFSSIFDRFWVNAKNPLLYMGMNLSYKRNLKYTNI